LLVLRIEVIFTFFLKGENFWYFSDLVSKIVSFAGGIFPTVSYGLTQIPSYPSGCIGFILCSMEEVTKI
jgi:spermidine synthase